MVSFFYHHIGIFFLTFIERNRQTFTKISKLDYFILSLCIRSVWKSVFHKFLKLKYFLCFSVYSPATSLCGKGQMDIYRLLTLLFSVRYRKRAVKNYQMCVPSNSGIMKIYFLVFLMWIQRRNWILPYIVMSSYLSCHSC